MKRPEFLSWLGSLLSPAEDPRRSAPAVHSDPESLLAEVRRSRAELAQVRSSLRHESSLAADLANEEAELLEVERNLLASMDERRAQEALLRARRRATEAELLVDD